MSRFFRQLYRIFGPITAYRMRQFIFISCLLLRALPGFGQLDSLTVSDTIGVSSSRGFLATAYSYRYYGAAQLSGNQIIGMLKRSPDSAVQAYMHQIRQLNRVSTGLLIGSIGLIGGSIATASRRYGPNGGLLLLGYGTLLGRLFPQNLSSRRLVQAVGAYNAYLQTRPADYVPPVVYASPQKWTLSLADTISGRRVGLTYRYTYRGIRVSPATQTQLLTASLNDREVNQGIRYVRTVNNISRVVGSVGRILVVSYATGLILTNSRRSRRNSTLNTDFLSTGLICLGANFVLSRHANGVQRRWVSRFNERLRQSLPTQ